MTCGELPDAGVYTCAAAATLECDCAGCCAESGPSPPPWHKQALSTVLEADEIDMEAAIAKAIHGEPKLLVVAALTPFFLRLDMIPWLFGGVFALLTCFVGEEKKESWRWKGAALITLATLIGMGVTLFVITLPSASMTDRDVKFSDGISSKPFHCRLFSFSTISFTSGSISASDLLHASGHVTCALSPTNFLYSSALELCVR